MGWLTVFGLRFWKELGGQQAPQIKTHEPKGPIHPKKEPYEPKGPIDPKTHETKRNS